MAKSIKNIKKRKPEQDNFFSKFNLEDILPQKYHLPAVILVIIILLIAFLNPLFLEVKLLNRVIFYPVKVWNLISIIIQMVLPYGILLFFAECLLML